MIPPYARTDPRSPHNTPEGMKKFFQALGIITLVCWLISGITDKDLFTGEWGIFALGMIFFGLAWIMGKATKS